MSPDLVYATVTSRSPFSVRPDLSGTSLTVDENYLGYVPAVDARVLVLLRDTVTVVSQNPGYATRAKASLGTINPAAAGSTSSTTYVDWPTTNPWSIGPFTKIQPGAVSQLMVWLTVTCYVTVAPTVVAFGVAVAGSVSGNGDKDVIPSCYFNDASNHRTWSGSVMLNIAQGDITLTVRVKRLSGTGVITGDTNDSITLSCMETFL